MNKLGSLEKVHVPQIKIDLSQSQKWYEVTRSVHLELGNYAVKAFFLRVNII